MSQSPPSPQLVLTSRQTAPFGLGGDLCEVIRDADGHLAMLIADVCGNGGAAAALVPELRLLARAFLRRSPSPGRVLTELNDWLVRVKKFDRFITAVALRIDPAAGHMRMASAGHLGPFVRQEDGRARQMPLAIGVALGVLPGQVYAETPVVLAPGETLVLVTDGITDPLSAKGDFLGEQAFVARLEAVDPRTAEAMCTALLRPARPHQSDATVVVLQIDDPRCPAEPCGIAG
jgi:sigma-B regulation protein RsbU (phosphoserine phosphatase)